MHLHAETAQIPLDTVLDSLGLEGVTLESAETWATDTRVWHVTHDDQPLAIRLFREGQREVCANECAAMTRARSAGIPAPEIIATGAVEGRFPAMAVEWAPGELLGETLLARPRLARRLGYITGTLLARIHDILGDQHDQQLDNDTWIGRGTARDPELAARLDEIASPAKSLLHLDYHPFNIVVRGSKVTGVLDWTNTTYGDPRADVARTVSTMQLAAPALIAERGAQRMSIGLFTRGFLDGYQAKIGALEQMAPFYAWAGNWMLKDFEPKLHTLPVADPNHFIQKVQRWTARWRQRALGHYSSA
jgi:aminoglycoside phosphotransferase (APT) family kinase protein